MPGLRRAALLTAVLVLAGAAGASAHVVLPPTAELAGGPAAACTAAAKAKRAAALAAFKRTAANRRAAYFRTHRGAKQRAAYRKRQRARLQALQRAVRACRPPARPPIPQSDVWISASAAADGELVRFGIAVGNRGPAAAHRVTVTDRLPPGAQLVSVSGSGWRCDGGTTVVCDRVGALPAASSAALALLVRPRAAGPLVNTAAIESASRDPRPGDNTATATYAAALPAAQLPDVAVTASVPGGPLRLHEPAALSVTTVNQGAVAAATVGLRIALPAGLRLISAPGCTGHRVLTCPGGDLAPGASRTVSASVRPLATEPQTATAEAAGSGDEATLANNTAAATLTAQPLPAYETPFDPGFSHQLHRPEWADDSRGTTYPWVGEWPKTPGVFHPGTGVMRGAVVFVDFPDAPGAGSLPLDDSLDLLRTDARAWYREASYGRFDLQLESVGGWFRMSQPVAAYGLGRCCAQAALRAFVQEAVALADPTVDFSRYDALWVIGPSSAWQSMNVHIDQRWPGGGIGVDGTELRRWISAPAAYPSVPGQIEPARFSHWIVTHEVGHLLGLPDLYVKPGGCPDCPNLFDAVGGWDLMSDVPLHAHFLAWHKWLLGWLDPAQLRGLPAPGTVETTLAPIAARGGVKAVVVPLAPSTALVVEAREPLGWERALCDRGVLVYTVDSSKPNADGAVRLRPAHASDPGSPCGPVATAAYDLGAGEVSRFEGTFPAAGGEAAVTVELLERLPDASYRVRVTRS